ncbi:hypothetical protein IFO70_08070 [Phormidium tenue FACHB-886]|nr:hypothetical protein [Phormidium tenue FACHB-886]
MLYKVNKFSDSTENQLLEIVAIQISLLECAASNSILEQTSCAVFLKHNSSLDKTADAIAAWIWNADSRCSPLKKFALGTPDEKNDLISTIKQDIETFRLGNGQLHHLAIPKNQRNQWNATPEWKRGAWLFLMQFYDELNNGFPSQIFSSKKSFDAQNFLIDFINHNKKLGMCAACEESDFHTERRDGILAEKDHYLPKSLYPHLCCHPLNLVPICHLCNLPKSNKDPLKASDGSRLNLEEIYLPYRDKDGLSSRTYLEVCLQEDPKLAKFTAIKPMPSESIQHKIDTVKEIYEIPDRWERKLPEERIGEQLFDHLLNEIDSYPACYTDESVLFDVLERFHERLKRLQGMQPFAYIHTWWLFTILEQVIEPSVTKSALTKNHRNLLRNLRANIDKKFAQEKETYGDEVVLEHIARSLDVCQTEHLRKKTDTLRENRKKKSKVLAIQNPHFVLLEQTEQLQLPEVLSQKGDRQKAIVEKSEPTLLDREEGKQQNTTFLNAKDSQSLLVGNQAGELSDQSLISPSQDELSAELSEIDKNTIGDLPFDQSINLLTSSDVERERSQEQLPSNYIDNDLLALIEAIVNKDDLAVWRYVNLLSSFQSPRVLIQDLINLYENGLILAKQVPCQDNLGTYSEETWNKLVELAKIETFDELSFTLRKLLKLSRRLQFIPNYKFAYWLLYCLIS